jgi:hypothetical protein
MALRLSLLGFPFAALTALVILLNSIDAGAGIAVAALGLVAVSGGATWAISLIACPSSRGLAATITMALGALWALTTDTAEHLSEVVRRPPATLDISVVGGDIIGT